MLLFVFTFSMLVSATLLFLVEPMIAKMLLPMLGGTPAVWNTCLVFFQVMLLAGYAYAYATLKWLSRRAQIATHVILVALPLLLVGTLPFHLPLGWSPPTQTSPVFWLLAVLTVIVGLPFFVLSSNTPVLQRWFGDSGHTQSADPYFLYAASNVGSLSGLLAYPIVLEPLLRLSQQARLWKFGYIGFLALTLVCATLVWNKRPAPEAAPATPDPTTPSSVWRQRLRWIALAFVPSSLMIGVTTQLTTDVPAIPLFWVLPLALYLISFILVFAKRPPISHKWLIQRQPFVILAALAPVVSQTKWPLGVLLIVYLLVLFVVAMVCHGELAKDRPAVSRLTEFYLLISVGGVLGGIFNSLLAPLIFRSVVEFPLALIAAAFLRPPVDIQPLTGAKLLWARRKDWLLPLALGLVMALGVALVIHLRLKPSRPLNILFFGYAMLWCLSFGRRPFRFALGVIVLVAVSSFFPGTFGNILHTERSFFGVSRVTNGVDDRFRYLFHGGTIHGLQNLDPAISREPLAYYTRTGPAGEIFRAQQARMPHTDWAFIGLGAGAMACYLDPTHNLTYYEIDPSVARIAQDPRYFTFLSQCAPQTKVVLGDARLELRNAPDHHYSLIVLDAFSGDTIPMHLITREALALYLRKLAPGGVLAFHISNLYLDLSPTLAELAHDGNLVDFTQDDTAVTQQEIDNGKFPAKWVVMARTESDLTPLINDTSSSARWLKITPQPNARVWTDDYSNMLTIIKWH